MKKWCIGWSQSALLPTVAHMGPTSDTPSVRLLPCFSCSFPEPVLLKPDTKNIAQFLSLADRSSAVSHPQSLRDRLRSVTVSWPELDRRKLSDLLFDLDHCINKFMYLWTDRNGHKSTKVKDVDIYKWKVRSNKSFRLSAVGASVSLAG